MSAIAATNRNLAKMVARGQFRGDLYYRLNVFPIRVPTLQERGDDIFLLTEAFLRRFAERMGRRYEELTDEDKRLLKAYSWPGNVRELENVLERAVILSNGPTLEIDPEVFTSATATRSANAGPPAPSASESKGQAAAGAGPTPPPESLESNTRNHILTALEQSGWVIEGPRGVAKILGLHPNTLRSRMKKLGVVRAPQEGQP